MGMSEKRRERELLRRAAIINRARPGDDEFDEQAKNWHVMPGLAIMWMIVVRSWRFIARRDRRRSLAVQASPRHPPRRTGERSQLQRQHLWTIGPKPLDTEE